jgi:hypothetical protein
METVRSPFGYGYDDVVGFAALDLSYDGAFGTSVYKDVDGDELLKEEYSSRRGANLSSLAGIESVCGAG